ncbi:MAG TPA: hypothetical protein VK855_03515 [Thioalkalivibrio sp.]|nr:hypothetical protein [Thioalkalivibrio sp.]
MADPSHMDTPLLVIGALPTLNLIVFFTGLLPYPTGWIILSAAFIGRGFYPKAR